MPRGVVDPRTRTLLLDAATDLLRTAGPTAVTVRALAQHAGVATGVLYNHFADRDSLLVVLILDRFRQQAEAAEQLTEQAGTATVRQILADFARTMVDPAALDLARLALARPELAERTKAALADGAPGLSDVEAGLARYLDAERDHGRIRPDADTAAAARVLIAAWHHLLVPGATGNAAAAQHDIDSSITTVLGGIGTDRPALTR